MWPSSSPPRVWHDIVKERLPAILETATAIVIAFIVIFTVYHIGKLLQSVAEWTWKLLTHLVHFIVGFGKLVTGMAIIVTIAAVVWGGSESAETLWKLYKILHSSI